MNVYKHNNYRGLITNWEQSEIARGARSRLARAAQCSPSWMTRVLAGSVQLTPDQAMGIAAHLHLTESETDYFLLLVDLERAGSPALRKRIEKKLEMITKESRKIAAYVKTDSSVSDEASVRYYSSWVYAAIHVACMIKPQAPEEISHLLLLQIGLVAKILKELREMGLLEQEGSRWKANSKNIHLPADHPIAKFTHSIWRSRTVQFLQECTEDGLHYSAVHCLSKADLETVHKTLRDTILNCRKIIQDSPSEVLGVFCLDWYKL